MPIEVATDIPYGSAGSRGGGRMDPLKGYYTFRPGEAWAPNVNLYENDTFYLVCVDLAGVDKEKIDLEIADQKLTIRGTRQVPMFEAPPGGESMRVRVHLMEIDHGAFVREVEIPQDVQREKVNASHRNGLLWIELPKKRG